MGMDDDLAQRLP